VTLRLLLLLVRTPTVFVRREGHVLLLQPLYDDPCTVLHHFTLQIGDKTVKVSTLQLKACSDPTAPPALPRHRGCPGTGAARAQGRPGLRGCPGSGAARAQELPGHRGCPGTGAARAQGLPTHPLLPGFSPARQHGGPYGPFRPTKHRGTAPGNGSPLVSCQD
jgi:hypothetical protein